MGIISESSDDLELQSMRSDPLPVRDTHTGALSGMSVEPHSIALHSEGEDEGPFIIPSAGQCLASMTLSSYVLVGARSLTV